MAPAHARRSNAKRILGWIAVSLAAVLVISVVGAWVVYRHLSGNINHIDISVPGAQPARGPGKAENILLIGSDTRAFPGGARFGSEVAGARSDTTILVHISANGGKAVLVSIPRDSWVQIPACHTTNGISSPTTNKFNAAFAIGGPSCTIATVQHLTGIHIDHVVIVDFAGFRRMVDALDGVNVCINHAINDPIRFVNGHYQGSGLVLAAGRHTLKGNQALAFVRARYGVGDGSDLGRIKNQQVFMSAVIRKATSTGLLIDLPRLYRFLDAATKSLTTDHGFGIPQLRKLAGELHGLKPGKVALLTVPLDLAATNVPFGDVGWDTARADLLWRALKTDGPLPGTEPRRPKPTVTPSATPLVVPPSVVHVRVLNGTGRPGLAHKVAADLSALGFQIDGVGDADASTYTTTVVRYGPDRNESSQTLAAAIPGATRQLDGALSSTLSLIVGSDYHGVQSVQVATPSTTPSPTPRASLDVVTAQNDVCGT